MVLNNTELRPFLEFEPQMKDVINAFGANDYKRALEVLDRYSVR